MYFQNFAGVVVDSQGHLYASDTGDNRVLGWKTAASFTNAQSADLVIGQPDFGSITGNQASGNVPTNGRLNQPAGLAVDASDNLYVVDQSNHRVLEFPTPFGQCSNTFPCVDSVGATKVFGQSNFNNAVPGTSTMDAPVGVAVDQASGAVFVADTVNNRVLAFTSPQTGANQTANVVIGQTSLSGNTAGHTQTTLNFPEGVFVDDHGNLWVADTGNNRVLEYASASLNSNGPSAASIFGQVDFNSNGQNQNGGNPTADTLFGPINVWVQPTTENVFITDTANDRILIFNAPALPATDPGADFVIGQADFTHRVLSGCTLSGNNTSSNSATPTAAGLCDPSAAVEDVSGNLYVADANNNRVLRYANGFGSHASASAVLGQEVFTRVRAPFVNDIGFWQPRAVAIDSAEHLYVADYLNNRVLGWQSALSFNNGDPATLVVGQTDFITDFGDFNSTALLVGLPTASNLSGPQGLAVDQLGNLFVADTGNQRVLQSIRRSQAATTNHVWWVTPTSFTGRRISSPGGGQSQHGFVHALSEQLVGSDRRRSRWKRESVRRGQQQQPSG